MRKLPHAAVVPDAPEFEMKCTSVAMPPSSGEGHRGSCGLAQNAMPTASPLAALPNSARARATGYPKRSLWFDRWLGVPQTGRKQTGYRRADHKEGLPEPVEPNGLSRRRLLP